MQTPRTTRSSVLGKRSHQAESFSSPSTSTSTSRYDKQLITPDPTPNPKRARVSPTLLDGDSNKENVPPFHGELANGNDHSPTSARTARALRRTTTEFVLATPSRARPAVRRHASTSSLIPATPTTEISYLTISTPPPTPPTSLLPIHARARALLRATCNSATTQIAGREQERTMIQNFLASFVDASSINGDQDVSSSLYISGSPGTGKTALVNSILRGLESELASVKIVTINCMALNSVDVLWDRLLEELDGSKKLKAAGRVKRVKGRDAVEAFLSNLQTKCILILDELDHIASTPSTLTSLFNLASKTPTTLRLIGIANTHTLTSSVSHLPSTTDVRTLHFSPYTPAQLLQILTSRLANLCIDGEEGEAERKKFLPVPTLTLLTKKVAALTGDVRSLFEVLRGAIDLAVASPPSSPSKPAEDNPLNTPPPVVTPTHILAALKAYAPASTTPARSSAPNPAAGASISASNTSNSEVVAKVRNLGLQARLALLSILLASKRLEAGLSLSTTTSVTSTPKSPVKRTQSTANAGSSQGTGVGIETTALYTYYKTVLTRVEADMFAPVSRSEFGDLVGMLEGVGLVSSSSAWPSMVGGGSPMKGVRRAFGRSASFGGAGATRVVGGEVRIVEGVRGDEVLRGLGVVEGTAAADVKEEEVRAIWEREKARLGRDCRTADKARSGKGNVEDAFEGAMED